MLKQLSGRIISGFLLVALASGNSALAQETKSWPGYKIDFAEWASCHYPWTDPGPMACVSPAGGIPAGYVPFLAQIFVDQPEEAFLPEFREGKTLYEMQHVCGGVLVAPDWVMTAAHCISKKNIGQNYKIRLGVDNIANRRAGIVFDIIEVIQHPEFKDFYKDDIALVRFAGKPTTSVHNPEFFISAEVGMRLGDQIFTQNQDGVIDDADPNDWVDAHGNSFVKFINIARPQNTPDDRMPWRLEEVDIYGWGKTEDVPGDSPAPDTYKVTLTVLPNAYCARMDGYDANKVPDTTFCAGHPVRKTCRGDSGGPVVDRMGNVIGIVSWGKNRCLGDGKPGVYTRVASYTEWIDGVIGESLRRRANESGALTAPGEPRQ